MVGSEMLKILVQRQFPVDKVRVFASERSVGKQVPYNGQSLHVERLDESSFKDTQVVMFAAGADISLMYGPIAAEAGALVIDKSSAWRMKANVPLVVPEVNGGDIADNEGIIASPNCTTIPLTMILEPLRQRAGAGGRLVRRHDDALHADAL